MMGVNTSMLAIGRQSGVTLIELVVTVVVAVILAAAAVPSLRGYVQNTRIATVTNDVVALVHDARSEAAIRGVPVGICPSDDGVECSGTWSDGWLSFLDLNNDGTRHYVQIKTKDIKDGEMCDPAADECFLRHYGAAPSGALFSMYCHCDSCRRSHAAPLYRVVCIDEAEFSVTEGAELITEFQKPGARVRRCFCQRCGSKIFNVQPPARSRPGPASAPHEPRGPPPAPTAR